jgi:peptidoglycan/xylan/chitin deacetylase (PgdA/CDA1 family)
MLIVFALAAVVTLAFAHAAPFPSAIDTAAGERAVWRVAAATGGPHVYLTFDDGPNPAVTPALLDVLKRERATATFFLIDRYLTDETAPIVRRMFDEGHGVALHSDTRRLALMKAEQLAETLTRAADRIEQLGGRRPCRAFRPHAGFRSSRMYAGLARIDHVLVGWGWNLWDWNWFRRKTGESIAPRLAGGASDGDIIVVHDGHHKNPRADRRYALDVTERLVPLLRGRGFSFRSVCEAIEPRRGSDQF